MENVNALQKSYKHENERLKIEHSKYVSELQKKVARQKKYESETDLEVRKQLREENSEQLSKHQKELEQLTQTFENRISSLTSKYHANEAALRQQLREDLDKHISAVNKLTMEIATLKADHSKELESSRKKA